MKLIPDEIAPTLISTVRERIAVSDGKGIRKLSNKKSRHCYN